MTLKQFIYLVIFLPIAYIVIRLFPIPILNFLLGAVIGGLGIALAFLPVNDRPLDVFLTNLYKRLTSPTQYIYKKKGGSIYFLEDVPGVVDQASTHLDSQQKLTQYLEKTNQEQVKSENVLDQRKQKLVSILNSPQSEEKSPPAGGKEEAKVQPSADADIPKPFVVGVVKNSKQIPLPGVLLYIKDERDTPIRLLKTNPHGIFATYSELAPGDYTFEIKDPKDSFFFDTMKIHLDKNNPRPLEFYSRELL